MKWRGHVLRTKLRIIDLRSEAKDVETPDVLDPSDYARYCDPIIIERVRRRIGIVDGYHRAAGLIGWAEEQEERDENDEAWSTIVEVLDATNFDLDAVAAAGDRGGYRSPERGFISNAKGIDAILKAKS